MGRGSRPFIFLGGVTICSVSKYLICDSLLWLSHAFFLLALATLLSQSFPTPLLFAGCVSGWERSGEDTFCFGACVVQFKSVLLTCFGTKAARRPIRLLISHSFSLKSFSILIKTIPFSTDCSFGKFHQEWYEGSSHCMSTVGFCFCQHFIVHSYFPHNLKTWILSFTHSPVLYEWYFLQENETL